MTERERQQLVERRTVGLTELRIEPLGEGETGGIGRMIGHASVFNAWSENLGGFVERVIGGAFTEAIAPGGDDVRALFNHNPSAILGRNRANTLTLSEDQRGLAINILLPDTSVARDLRESVNRGDVTQMSFGFRAVEEEWETTPEGEPDRRTLKKVRLFDVSPATFPAYPETDLAVRSLEAWREAEERAATPAGTPALADARRRMAMRG